MRSMVEGPLQTPYQPLHRPLRGRSPSPYRGGTAMLRGTANTIGKARKLRRQLSLPEGLLWRELRGRRMGPRFRKQHPAGPFFVLDFACLEAKLAIEIDGDAHDRGDRPARDEGRDEWLANHGFRTLRIPAKEVLQDVQAVVAFIVSECEALNSSPAGGGGPAAKRAVEGLAKNPKKKLDPSASLDASSPSPEQPLHHASHGPPPRTGEDRRGRGAGVKEKDNPSTALCAVPLPEQARGGS